MFDVAVIGAGPAGAWAAARLAAAGARVAIVDGSHPREKPCGGGITARALEIVRPYVPRSAFASVRVTGAVFESTGRRAGVALTPGVLEVVSRRVFDEAMLTAARSAGAAHVAARATDIAPRAGGWTIAAGGRTLVAGWLIGADGVNSFVRRRVARPFPRRELSICTGFFVHGATGADVTVGFVDEPAGYLWSFPRPDHLAVGVCAQADAASSAVLARRAEAWIRANLRVPSGALERYSWPVPSLSEAALRSECPLGPRWMLLGDAAGLVDPITREGIYFALRSAEGAAASLNRGRPEEYAAMVRGEIHTELTRAARLKRRFFRPRFTRRLLRALERSPRVRMVMADLVAGEQTYKGLRRRLFGTREWRLMLELLRGRI